MKKQKHNRRRLVPLAPPSNQALAATARAGRRRGRRMAWLGGIGLVLVAGFIAYHMRRPKFASDSAVASATNSVEEAAKPPARSPEPATSETNLVGVTNRPGAAINRQQEGQAVDLNNQATRYL